MEDLKEGMCRCCAAEGTFKDISALYQWMGAEEVYGDMLKDCFDITLSTSLVNNGGICEVCITQLRNAFNFKKQVLNTEEQFKKLQENLLKGDIVKIEMGQDSMDNSDGGEDMLDDDFSSPEYDLPIKSIKREKEENTKKRPARASTSKPKKPKPEVGEPSTKRKSDRGVINENHSEARNYGARSDLYKKLKFNLGLILKYSNATPIRCKGGIGYACCFCKEEFPDASELKDHSLDHYEFMDEYDNQFFSNLLCKGENNLCIKLDITGLNCKLCTKSIRSLDDLYEHLKKSHHHSVHTDIMNYIVPFKLDSDPLKCCLCSKEFKSFKTVLEHMNTHFKNFTCSICAATFLNKFKLNTHEMTHVISEFKCRYCPEVLETKIKKMCHENSKHKNYQKTRRCGYCGDKFLTSLRKDKHMEEVHGVPMKKKDLVICQICLKEFSKDHYNEHMRRVHLLEKRYNCDVCFVEVFTLSELKNHMVVHTDVKAFACDQCQKSFKRKKALLIHKRIHERQTCEYCGLVVDSLSVLETHIMLNHDDEVTIEDSD